MAKSKYKIKAIPIEKRPREKLIQKGPQNLKDEELYKTICHIYLQ